MFYTTSGKKTEETGEKKHGLKIGPKRIMQRMDVKQIKNKLKKKK